MESRGRNKNKNKTEKFVQSIHKFFFKSNTKPKIFYFDFHFFVVVEYSSILSYKSF